MTIPELADAEIDPETLVEVEQPSDRQRTAFTPQKQPTEPKVAPLARQDTDLLKDKENELPKLNGKQPALADDADAMKTIEI
jgi:hypothetical protein